LDEEKRRERDDKKGPPDFLLSPSVEAPGQPVETLDITYCNESLSL